MTSATASIPASPLRSSAEEALSSYKSLLLEIEQGASSGRNPAELQSLVNLAEQLTEFLKIEPRLMGCCQKRLDIVEAFHAVPRRHSYFGVVGGNRAGKSVCGGWLMFAKHLRDVALPNSVYWCVAPTIEKSIAGQQKELWDALPKPMFAAESYNSKSGFGGIRTSIILEPDKRKIVVRFKTAAQYDSDPASFEQEKVAGVWVDETVPKGVIDRLTARLIDLNGWMIVTTIPDDDWLDEEFGEEDTDDPVAGVKSIRLTVYDNIQNLSEAGVDRARSRWSEDEQQMRIWGKSLYKTGLVYHEFIKDYKPVGHLVRPFKIPSDWPRFRGLDVGRDHPTVCLWLACAPNDNLYVYREYVARQTTVETDAHKILDMSSGEMFLRACLIDPTAYNITKNNPQSVAQQFMAAGLRCMPAKRGSNLSGQVEFSQVQQVKRRLEQFNFFVFDTCSFTITNFRKWRYRRDRDNKPVGKGDYEDRNNDALDVIRYVVNSFPTFERPRITVESTIDY